MAQQLFDPDRLDVTLELLLDPALDSDRSRDRERLESELHDCDRRVQRYRALLDRGVDPDVVAGWLNEVAAARRVAEHRLAELQARHTEFIDRDAIRTVLGDIGGLAGLLASSDPCDRAQFYEAVGIAGTYEPQVNQFSSPHTLLRIWFVLEDRSTDSRTGHWRLVGSAD